MNRERPGPAGDSHCRIGVIGSGTLARALLQYSRSRSLSVAGIWARRRSAARSLGRAFGVPVFKGISELTAAGEIIVLAVSDDAIPEVAREVARHSVRGRLFLHSSGCLPLDVLRPIDLAGGATGIVHPLMTLISTADRPDPLAGAPLGIVGSDSASEKRLRLWFKARGHRVFRLFPGPRPLYHAAAVLACAGLHRVFSTAAHLMAAECAISTGMAKEFLAPMAESALRLAARPGREVISGPWARDDSLTVRHHAGALRADHPKVLRLYRALMALSSEPR